LRHITSELDPRDDDPAQWRIVRLRFDHGAGATTTAVHAVKKRHGYRLTESLKWNTESSRHCWQSVYF
jgi:hypothetical protein